jgi:RecQ family ATP-dependent DNA helicase
MKHASLHASLGARFLQVASVRIAKLFGGEELKNLQGDRLGLALRYFGVKRLRPNQLEPIIAALNQQDVLLVSPTGSGKSICFQVPALLGESHSIVVSPLKALMADQVLGLLARGVPATFLNSDLSRSEMATRLNFLKRGFFKLVYLAPERFAYSRTRDAELRTLFGKRPSYLVIDEAHCIDKWGDAFRPDYSEIGTYRKNLGSPPVLAFTATANPTTRAEILNSLDATNAKVFVEDVDRTNIALLRLRMRDMRKRAELVAELHNSMRHMCSGKTLVFVATRKQGEDVAELLVKQGIQTEFFHGGLDVMEREAIIQRFSTDSDVENPNGLSCLICTNAFGMGMDIPDVRLVFHWHHPSSVEDYAQEFGRAGRDGHQSLAVVFWGGDDCNPLYSMAKKTITKSIKAGKLSADAGAKALEKRVGSIKRINSFVTHHDQCFTQLLLDDLGAAETKLPKISRFFLELAFVRSRRNEKRQVCCDGCWRSANDGPVSDFARHVVKLMGSS